MPPANTTVAATARVPLHERLGCLGQVRGRARSAMFNFLRKLAGTDDAKTIQVDNLRNLLPRRAELPRLLVTGPAPYPDLGRAQTSSRADQRSDVVFITARFRSGSTLLWNLFRQLEGCTSYYEPFNERRWFDAAKRGERVDATHRGVEDYWREYDGLGDLSDYYREDWTNQNLFMDGQSWDPDMKRYVEIMIDRAPGRPVLQFNRIDFRLPWFRHHFPNAKLVHLYRHPRDQWLSSLVNPRGVPRELTPAEFAGHDHYYLLSWARDLKYYFPFLDEAGVSHPYELFYFIWKLSYLFGQAHAHLSLGFESLTADPTRRLAELCDALALRDPPLDRLKQVIDKPRSGRWGDYAPEAWFQAHESRCEDVIAEFFTAAPRSE